MGSWWPHMDTLPCSGVTRGGTVNNSDLMIETSGNPCLYSGSCIHLTVTFWSWPCLLKLTGNLGFLFTVTGLLDSGSEALLVSLLCTKFCC